MTLIGLDLSSTRLRAVQGPPQNVPMILPLSADHDELPLALSLEDRAPAVGAAGTALRRQKPYLACLDFLGHLGTRKEWTSGHHRLDALQALHHVFQHLHATLGPARGVLAALPAYFTDTQQALVTHLAAKLRWRWLGSVPAPLAAAYAAQEQLPFRGVAVVVDLDGHALTFTAVAVDSHRMRYLDVQSAPQLAEPVWLVQLLNRVADRCIRRTRRDPRELAATEQDLYDQLTHVLAANPADKLIELVLQTPHWYQNLMLQHDDLRVFCESLVRQAVAEWRLFRETLHVHGRFTSLLFTAPAARLPGLVAGLQAALAEPEPAAESADDEEEDFGANLLRFHDGGDTGTPVHVLTADAIGRAAHHLLARMQRGELPRGHLDSIRLPTAHGDDLGPPRLQYRGRDHYLDQPLFTLGADASCDMVFSREQYPSVAATHCEISYDRRVYTLRDRSRQGTLVNDHPIKRQTSLHSGDWIRLGPSGPVVYFLGQPHTVEGGVVG
jgi:FHA domain